MNEEIKRQIAEILRTDGAIPALSALRENTGIGLREAKAFIDALVQHAARFAFSSPSADERKRIDEQAARSWGGNSWAAGVRRARDLEDQSYDLCDRSRNGELSYDEVQSRLRQLCPGFSDEIYGLAYDRGMLASR